MSLHQLLANNREIIKLVDQLQNCQPTDLERFIETFKLVNVRTTLLRDTNFQYLVVGEYPANALKLNPFLLMDTMSLVFKLDGELSCKKDSVN